MSAGDDHLEGRSACCGLKCFDSCWTRRLVVNPEKLFTTCNSPSGGLLPVVNVSLRRLIPGGIGGMYRDSIEGGSRRIKLGRLDEIDFVEEMHISTALVTPRAEEGCGVFTPWFCKNSLRSLADSPGAPYLNSSRALSLPVDYTGSVLFTDLLLQNAPSGPYQIGKKLVSAVIVQYAHDLYD